MNVLPCYKGYVDVLYKGHIPALLMQCLLNLSLE